MACIWYLGGGLSEWLGFGIWGGGAYIQRRDRCAGVLVTLDKGIVRQCLILREVQLFIMCT